MIPTLDQMKQDAIEAVKVAALVQGRHPRDIETSEIFECVIPAENHQLIDLLGDDLTSWIPPEQP